MSSLQPVLAKALAAWYGVDAAEWDSRHILAALAADPATTEAVAAALPCSFFVRADGRSKTVHLCGRTKAEHPIVGMGRFWNHENYLPPDMDAAALVAALFGEVTP